MCVCVCSSINWSCENFSLWSSQMCLDMVKLFDESFMSYKLNWQKSKLEIQYVGLENKIELDKLSERGRGGVNVMLCCVHWFATCNVYKKTIHISLSVLIAILCVVDYLMLKPNNTILYVIGLRYMMCVGI